MCRTRSLPSGTMWGLLVLGVMFQGAFVESQTEADGKIFVNQYNDRETEADGEIFVNQYNDRVGDLWNQNVKASWNYYTNITGYNLEVMVRAIKTPMHFVHIEQMNFQKL